MVLNPKRIREVDQQNLGAYGCAALGRICEKLQAVDGFQPARAAAEFYAFKVHARTTASGGEGLQSFAAELLSEYKEDYTDFSILMEYFLVVPLNSASCERGFSSQNYVKTKSRNRITDERQNQLLRISINGPDSAKFDYQNAAVNFRAIRNRMK